MQSLIKHFGLFIFLIAIGFLGKSAVHKIEGPYPLKHGNSGNIITDLELKQLSKGLLCISTSGNVIHSTPSSESKSYKGHKWLATGYSAQDNQRVPLCHLVWVQTHISHKKRILLYPFHSFK